MFPMSAVMLNTGALRQAAQQLQQAQQPVQPTQSQIGGGIQQQMPQSPAYYSGPYGNIGYGLQQFMPQYQQSYGMPYGSRYGGIYGNFQNQFGQVNPFGQQMQRQAPTQMQLSQIARLGAFPFGMF